MSKYVQSYVEATSFREVRYDLTLFGNSGRCGWLMAKHPFGAFGK